MEFTPDKNREDAIAELLGSRDYVLITASDLQDQEDGAAHRQRGHLLVAGAATRAAQGLSAFAQLWLSAPQQQAPDRVAAPVGVQKARHFGPAMLTTTAPATAVPVLRRCDGHRAPTNLAVLGRTTVSPS